MATIRHYPPNDYGSASARVVLVSGGASGIGLETARTFGRARDTIVLCDISPHGLKLAADELREEGIEAEIAHGSVADPSDVIEIVQGVHQEFGRLDVLVANAGIGLESAVVDTPVDAWNAVFETNARGVFLMSREAVKAMSWESRGGVILITSSINALAPESPGIAYSCSKAAVDAFVRGLAVEVASRNIRVCGVCPGYIDTPMLAEVYAEPEELRAWTAIQETKVPLGRLGRADEIASVFFFLASRQASYITGTSIVVDGGRLANV